MDPMTVTHSLCEPAVEMHMDMSQDRIYRENGKYRKTNGAP